MPDERADPRPVPVHGTLKPDIDNVVLQRRIRWIVGATIAYNVIEADGAQVVDRLRVHAEVFGDLADRQHRLEAESGYAFGVNDT